MCDVCAIYTCVMDGWIAGEEDEFHDADEYFSVSSRSSHDALRSHSLSRRNISNCDQETLLDRLASWWHCEGTDDESIDVANVDAAAPGREATPKKTIVEEDNPVTTGCISLFTAAQAVRAHKKFLSYKPKAGSSFKELELHSDRSCAWEIPDPTTFQIRSKDYMKTRVKVPCETCIYRWGILKFLNILRFHGSFVSLP